MRESDAALTANGPLMAQDDENCGCYAICLGTISVLTRSFAVERVTRIELA
jgi:hypothetical protein